MKLTPVVGESTGELSEVSDHGGCGKYVAGMVNKVKVGMFSLATVVVTLFVPIWHWSVLEDNEETKERPLDREIVNAVLWCVGDMLAVSFACLMFRRLYPGYREKAHARATVVIVGSVAVLQMAVEMLGPVKADDWLEPSRSTTQFKVVHFFKTVAYFALFPTFRIMYANAPTRSKESSTMSGTMLAAIVYGFVAQATTVYGIPAMLLSPLVAPAWATAIFCDRKRSRENYIRHVDYALSAGLGTLLIPHGMRHALITLFEVAGSDQFRLFVIGVIWAIVISALGYLWKLSARITMGNREGPALAFLFQTYEDLFTMLIFLRVESLGVVFWLLLTIRLFRGITLDGGILSSLKSYMSRGCVRVKQSDENLVKRADFLYGKVATSDQNQLSELIAVIIVPYAVVLEWACEDWMGSKPIFGHTITSRTDFMLQSAILLVSQFFIFASAHWLMRTKLLELQAAIHLRAQMVAIGTSTPVLHDSNPKAGAAVVEVEMATFSSTAPRLGPSSSDRHSRVTSMARSRPPQGSTPSGTLHGPPVAPPHGVTDGADSTRRETHSDRASSSTTRGSIPPDDHSGSSAPRGSSRSSDPSADERIPAAPDVVASVNPIHFQSTDTFARARLRIDSKGLSVKDMSKGSPKDSLKDDTPAAMLVTRTRRASVFQSTEWDPADSMERRWEDMRLWLALALVSGVSATFLSSAFFLDQLES